MDRSGYSAKFVIADLGLAPAKGTAVITFPTFADGQASNCLPIVWVTPSHVPHFHRR